MTGKTTLFRMRDAAMAEASRIESVQDMLVREGARRSADEDQMRRRDDFDGIVRLIDLILGDRELQERLRQ